jgi:aryl-alcohol dehydrogenase-like predicted oxidoreductase
MRSITLANTDITTSAIGFGCNALLGGTHTRRQAIALLETAYDLGVRHFDTARSYEAGDSEDIVGEFSRNKRDKITITTKFRINAAGDYHQETPAQARLRRQLRTSPLVVGAIPVVKRLLGRGSEAPSSNNAAPTPVVPKAYEKVDVDLARRSLDTSLRELRTDYVDLFFIHEAEKVDCQPELLAFLEQVKKEGKIRQFGIGSAYYRTRDICCKSPEFAPVIQFDSNLFTPQVAEMATLGIRGMCTHGAVAALPALQERIAALPPFAANLRRLLNRDLENRAMLASFLLQFALWENPNGIVLFRSSQPGNIRDNLQSLSQNAFPETTFPAVAAMLKGNELPG